MFKIEKKDNYFVVTNTTTGQEEIREPRDQIKWKKDTSNDYTFYYNIPNLTAYSDGVIALGIDYKSFAFADIVDSTSTAFASVAALDTFLEQITGNICCSSVTLQHAYDNSTTPEILTNSTLGAVSFKRGSGADTDDVIEVLDGAGAQKASVKGNGFGLFQKITIGTAFALPTADGTSGQVMTTNGSGVVSWSTISSGLTVGTTAISSGIVGRILFEGAGNVLQEDSALFWDNTNKYLGIGATPTKSLQVGSRFTVGSDGVVNWGSALTGNNRGFLTWDTNKAIIQAIHTLALYSGGNERLLIDNNGLVGIGITPTSKLDVKAQGALSTDIALRVRNSANSDNIFAVHGNTGVYISGASGLGFVPFFAVNRGGSTVFAIDDYKTQITGELYVNTIRGTGTDPIDFMNQSGPANFLRMYPSVGSLLLGTTNLGTSATNTIGLSSGTAPTTSPADMFQMYSADQTAGNACPHFRTENGAIVKIYQETTAVSSATLVSGGGTTLTDTDTFDGYTIKQIVKALRNMGALS
jgi:hypothetical protein